MSDQPPQEKSGSSTTVTVESPTTRDNTQVIKALVVGLDDPPEKTSPQARGTSKAKVQEDYWKQHAEDFIDPPINMEFLATVEEYSTILQQCIEVMEVNIEGFGARLIPLSASDPEQQGSAVTNEIAEEKLRLNTFLSGAAGEDSLVSLRRRDRHDREATGNAFLEVVRHPLSKLPDKLVHVPSYQIRLGKTDDKYTKYTVHRQVETAPGVYEVKEVEDWKRFRRYLQLQTGSSSAGDVVWFKDYGDPRVIDCRTGEVVPDEDLADFDEQEYGANELIHSRIYSSRTPYGLPRYKGCLITLLGDREAEEVNYTTLMNNNIPSMVVAVSNGQVTEETVDRMKDFVKEQIQGSRNYSKFLILEAEGTFEGTDPGNIRLDIKPLAQHQMKDQLFQEYGRANREKIRQCFRIPPIFIGVSEDYTRATAEASRRLADEQIFRPERDEVDHMWNRLLYEFGMKHHRFKSNGPNITDDEDLLKLLVAAEKAGGMTPRIATQIVSDILGSAPIEKWGEGIDPDQPFSLTIAERVKNQADPTEPGQQVTAQKSLTSVDTLAAIMALREQVLMEVNRRAMEA
jgi:PBSX family phage portal protein